MLSCPRGRLSSYPLPLDQAVIDAVPLHRMMKSIVPKEFITKIQKVQRALIWGDHSLSKSLFSCS